MFDLFKRRLEPASMLPPLNRSQLRPLIVHSDFVRIKDKPGAPEEHSAITAPLCGDLALRYVFDLGDYSMSVSPFRLESVGVAQDDLPAIALANLARALPAPKYFSQDGCGVAFVGNALEASLLLIDAVWADVESRLSGDLVVATPCQDAIVLCDGSDSLALATLGIMSHNLFDEKDHPAHRLSPQLMARRSGAWVLLDRNAREVGA